MVDIKDYIQKITAIRMRNLLSLTDIAHEIGVSYNTLMRIMDLNNPRPLALKTLRKIKLFVTKYEGN